MNSKSVSAMENSRSSVTTQNQQPKRHGNLTKKSPTQGSIISNAESTSGLNELELSPSSAIPDEKDAFEPIVDNRQLFIKVQFDGTLAFLMKDIQKRGCDSSVISSIYLFGIFCSPLAGKIFI